MEYRTLKQEKVLDGPSFRVRRDTVCLESDELAAAPVHERDVVEHPGAVVIVPVLPDGRLAMIYQYRHAIGQSILEFPAGTLEKGESPEACARRELSEEAGYLAAQFESLGSLFPAPGFCDEVLHVFLANNLSPQEVSGDTDEIIEVRLYSVDQVASAIRDGSIADAKTIAAFCRATLIGHIPADVPGCEGA